MRDTYLSSSRRHRGFSLITVTILVGLMSISALAVLRSLEFDAQLNGLETRNHTARSTAQGGLRELINDSRILNLLPSAAGESSKLEFSKPTSSEFFGSESTDPTYAAEVTLIRSAPALESSQRNVRMVLYEADIRGKESTGHAVDIEAVIYRLGVVSNNQSGSEVFGR